jgi:hypothetical protein
MIDFERFWAEPGCAPGMSKEETEAYLKQEVGGMPLAALVPEGALDPGPGVTAEEIAAWEQEHGVRLPDVLRQALARQNGGYVRDSQFRVLPLKEIIPPDDEFWEYATYEEEDVPDRELVLQFGEDECGGTCLFNYARGPQQEPSVYVYHSDPGDLDKCSDSAAKFFGRMLKTAEAPSVDWSETASLEVVAREMIDLSRLHAKGAASEQILGRQGGALVLFTHERTPGEERFTKTTLPEPLLQDFAMIMRRRPDPINTYGLMLQPQEPDGIVEHESKKTRDGRWKNSTSRGVPICVQFESHDRTRLEALRRSLFGEKTADRAQAREKSQEELQQRLASRSPEERQAAGLSMFQQMKQRLFPGGPPNPEEMPPEAAALQELLQKRLAEIEKRVKERAGGQPVSPEIQRLLGEMMKPAPEDVEGEE